MNITQSAGLLILTAVILVTGCDVITGEKAKVAEVKLRSQTEELSAEISSLKDQNSQLTQMLEEAEMRLAEKTTALEATLRESEQAKQELQTSLTESKEQFLQVSVIAQGIREDLETNNANLQAKLSALELLSSTQSNDQAADPLAEKTSDHSDHDDH